MPLNNNGAFTMNILLSKKKSEEEKEKKIRI